MIVGATAGERVRSSLTDAFADITRWYPGACHLSVVVDRRLAVSLGPELAIPDTLQFGPLAIVCHRLAESGRLNLAGGVGDVLERRRGLEIDDVGALAAALSAAVALDLNDVLRLELETPLGLCVRKIEGMRRMYASIADDGILDDGGRVLSLASLTEAARLRHSVGDERFSRGFVLDSARWSFGLTAGALATFDLGGSIAWADPSARVAVIFVAEAAVAHIPGGDPRWLVIRAALNETLSPTTPRSLPTAR
jgi:hypothetical protein